MIWSFFLKTAQYTKAELNRCRSLHIV